MQGTVSIRNNENYRGDILIAKNDFAEVSKNLARYRSENNFVELSKELYIHNY